MDDMSQHFAVWKAFNRRIYKQTLTQEEIIGNGGEKFIDEVFELQKVKDGYIINEGKQVGYKCIFLEKSGIKYILPTRFEKYLPLNVKLYFECYLKRSDKTVYRFITEPASVKITPEKTLTFKQLIEVFNPVPHTNPKTWSFLKIQAIASKAKGGKYRLCSRPATGKNANDTILHCITNDNVKISTPTIAKLETLFYFNQKVILDEFTSITQTQIKDVESFFSSLADESPTFQKHSMAKNRDMNEVDISRTSCIFTYNDRASLLKGSKFFDDIWQNPAAFKSRYPSLYLDGETMSPFRKLSVKEAENLLDIHFDKLRMLSRNIIHYILNMQAEMHGYNRNKLNMSGRWRVNFECVIDALDVYSETQEEFDDWLTWINKCVSDYQVKNFSDKTLFAEEEEVR